MHQDGDIDFSLYTREQLENAVARMDRERYPINFQNLIAEYQRRRVAERLAAEVAVASGTVAPPDRMLSPSRAFAVTFEPTASFINWLGPSRNDFHLVGSGKLRIDDALVRVTGRRFRIFIGLPVIDTEELARQFVCNVECEGSVVRFELRVPGEEVQGVTLWLASAAEAEELSKILPVERTPDFTPQLKMHVEFEQALIAQSPKTPITYALIIACVCVYVTTALGTNHLLGFDGQSLVGLGSNFGPYTTDGDWWRLLTAMFLHLGIIHLAFNMWALASFGPLVERLYGSVFYFLIYMGAGLAGGLASVSWRPEVNSVGASGAIFGIFGALLAVQIHNGGSIPVNVLRPLRYTSSLYIALSLFVGLSASGVDNAAHIGGIAAGFLMGLTVSRPITGSRLGTREFSRRVARGTSVAVCVLAVGVWGAKEGSTRLTGQGLFAQTLHWYLGRESANLALWHGSRNLATTLHFSDEAYANWLNREVVPFWAEADRRFQRIELTKTSPSYSHLESFRELASGRLHAFGLIVSGLRQHDEKMTTAGADEIRAGDKLIHEKLQ
jgi:membrane associated rhomboid family serine protease